MPVLLLVGRGRVRRRAGTHGGAGPGATGNWALAGRPVRLLGGVSVEVMTADLISRARAGDGDAFRELTEPHRRELQVHC